MTSWRLMTATASLMLIVSCAGPYRQASVRNSAVGPGGTVSVTYFHDELSPYGRWVWYEPYGWCWAPYGVSAGWRPYSDGHWAYTDFGWAWVANEPWGWAPYHYGRWTFDGGLGWLWVPGTEWAPAWVAWRDGDDWVGWAALPPAARWETSGGLRFEESDRIPSQSWCFVPRDRLVDADVRGQVVSVTRAQSLLPQTRDATRFELRDGHPADVGLETAGIERRIGRPLPRLKVVDMRSATQSRSQVYGAGAIGFYRPRVRQAGPGAVRPR